MDFQKANGLPATSIRPFQQESPSDQAFPLGGLWGVGFDSIPGASAGSGLVPGISTANALALRYWVNDRFSMEGKLALSVTSQPAGVSGTSTTGAWGLGTQMKYNIARPTTYLLAQFLGGVSLAQLGQTSNGVNPSGDPVGQTTTTLNIMVGVGFEAFVPVWRALSLEGNVGLNISSVQAHSAGSAQATQSSSSLGINGAGFTPLNVAIHYYF